MSRSSRNSSLLSAAAFSVAIAVGCASPQKSSEQSPVSFEVGSIEWRVQEEVSRHHRAVVTLFSGNENHDGIRFVKEVKEKEQPNELSGLIGHHGAFDEKRGFISINESVDPELVNKSIDAIDHEIAHAIYSVLYSEDPSKRNAVFTGPSLERLQAYCTKRVAGPEFQEIRDDLEAWKKFELFRADMKKFNGGLLYDMEQVINFTRDPQLPKKVERAKAGMSSHEHDQLTKDVKRFNARFAEFKRAFSPVAHQHSASMDRIKESFTSESLDECVRISAVMKKVVESFADLVQESERIKNVLLQARLREAERNDQRKWQENENEIARLKRELQTETDPKVRASLRSSIFESMDKSAELNPEHRKMMRDLEETTEKFENKDLFRKLMVSNSHDLIDTVAKFNIETIENILGDANEVFARMVDSLFNVYFGPVEQNQFPLTEVDLEFLLQFKANGEQVFAAAVERYRVGMSLMARGYAPMEIRELLEYAKTFTLDGKLYVWERSSFTLHGPIEVLKR